MEFCRSTEHIRPRGWSSRRAKGNVKAISLEEAIKVMDIDEATLEEFLVFLGGTMIRAVKTILTTSRQQSRHSLPRIEVRSAGDC